MATTQSFIEFVCDQIETNLPVRYRKMFGEYMVYINEKPILLVCNNTVYVKKLDCIREFAIKLDVGFPYKGAKEHYMVDVDDKELFNAIIQELEKVIPVPVKKKPKKKRG
jgi:TfoX/Sxy family transcriptional regulator of competence genes